MTVRLVDAQLVALKTRLDDCETGLMPRSWSWRTELMAVRLLTLNWCECISFDIKPVRVCINVRVVSRGTKDPVWVVVREVEVQC